MSARAFADLLEEAIACPSPLQLALADLDARLAREVARMHARGITPIDELRGLYVSEDRVARILAPAADPFEAREHQRGALTDHLIVHPAWRALAEGPAPTAIERDLVLLALARDLRAEYELVFGFLNDDLTRRWPTRDLAARLLARDAGDVTLLRDASAERAPLVTAGVLATYDAGDRTSWLAAGLAVTPLAAALLTDADTPETRLPAGIALLRTASSLRADSAYVTAWARLARIVREAWSGEPVPAVILEGRDGSGRAALAGDLATALDCPLLRVDVRSVRTTDTDTGAHRSVGHAVTAALIWQRLAGAVVLIDGAEEWCPGDDGPHAPPSGVLDRLAAATGPVLFRVAPETRWHGPLRTLHAARVSLGGGSVADRAGAWRREINRAAAAAISDADALALADRFDLTQGHVARVVRRAADEGALDDASGSGEVARRVAEAARADSCEALAGLAARAPTPHGWDDLVLPAPTMARLRDFASAVRDRAIVLDAWGFGRRAARSRGITALFAGASGTGKTMAAGVVAQELGLDLVVIDLSTIVSKYIGETEKQLQKVFRAARDPGAILFFDEADALFGKRSEVKDAHDRYANIEVAYLLQQLDVHDGIVILATNLSRNLDAAFSRRMRYVLEFPLPAEADRLRLWRGIFPKEAPLAPDVDLEFLAARFHLAGGDIRNVALEGAYLAAADGERSDAIAMRHVIRAMARQIAKQGKTPSAAEFGPYVGLIDRDG